MGWLMTRTSIVAGGGAGASIAGGVLTVNGSGFGSKSTAAPEFFNNFSANSDGDSYAQAGFDYRSANTSFISATVQSSPHTPLATGHKYYRNRWGGGAYQSGAATDPFHQSGVYMPGTLKCHCSYWLKIVRVSGAAWTTDGQWKGPRWGENSAGLSSSTAGDDLYNETCKAWSELFDSTTDSTGSDNVKYRDVNDNPGDQYANLGSHVEMDDGNWHLIDDFGSFNSVGSANGERYFYTDGVLRLSRTDQQPRTLAGQTVEFCIPNPGMTNGYLSSGDGRVVDGLMSNIIIDSCFASVFLINQSTLSGALRYYLPALTWSDTQVTATCNSSLIPSGYNWAVVLNENLTSQVFAL